MADLLFRLGAWCVRRARVVLAVWLSVLAAVVGLGVTMSGPTTDDFTIPGTESLAALERLDAAFPQSGGVTGQIVIQASDDATLADPAVADDVRAATTAVGQLPGVSAVLDPATAGAVSRDGRVGLATVQFDVPFEDLPAGTLAAVDQAVEPARAAGLTVELGGDAFVPAQPENHLAEVIGFLAAAVILALVFRSALAAALTLLTALVGVGIGLSAVSALTGVVELSSTTPTLALMLGLAVGIDYALLIVSRHRDHRRSGMPVAESIALATATSGSSVVFAGGTVVVALAGLSVVGVPFLTAMGLAAAATVTVAILVAVTLLPAVLALAGRRLDPRHSGVPTGSGVPTDGRSFRRWSGLVVRRPVQAALAVSAALVVVAIPLGSLQLGLPGAATAPADRSDRRAYDLVADAFGPGVNGPLVVLVDGADAATVTATSRAVAQTVRGLPDVAVVSDPVPNESGTAALVTVTPQSGPQSEATATLVADIRDAVRDLPADVAVTGQTAVDADITEKLTEALPRFLAVVVGLALLLLVVVFRSLIVPVVAVVGFLLTIGATLGAVVAVFQWGWLAPQFGVDAVGPILTFLPVLVVGILFGLAMDYQVFLVGRIREEHAAGATPLEAIRAGFAHSGRVVVAAALIMIAVFGGFVLSSDPVIQSVGFALAVGVAVDAFLVRMVVVPALLALLGRRAWSLPAWLDRRLPSVDVEGAHLLVGGAASPVAPKQTAAAGVG
ncbi:MAG: MMPL family transporter [Dermatophilaceae bacterium]